MALWLTIRWRVCRTRPAPSVVQVFLIHGETGLLLEHVATTAAPVKDAHVVSGMLTAIIDFVRDSFKTKDGETLDRMRVGDLVVTLAHGRRSRLIVLTRGAPCVQVSRQIQRTLATIEERLDEELRAFRGDVEEQFVPARSLLMDLMGQMQRTDCRSSS